MTGDTGHTDEARHYEQLLDEGAAHFGEVKIGRPGRSRSYHWIVGGLIRVFLFLIRPWQRIRITGEEHIPRTGPVILVGNHESFMDPIVVVAKVWRPITAFAKAEHFWGRFGWFYRGMGQIPLERGGAGATDWSLAVGVSVLRQGGAVAIYPEATRVPGIVCHYFGRLVIPLLEGCPHVPLVPVAVTYEKRRFGKVAMIRVGEPRRYEGDVAARGDEIMRELRLWTSDVSSLPTTNEHARDVKERRAQAGR
ncbi:MAG: lysophospholipid acyltransferase family protein [Acidimicrobiales bacterium]